MTALAFQNLFHSDDPARDKFLSRVFGIFNEEIVRCWAKAPQAPYEDLGRPTVRRTGEKTPYHTLDFTFRSKSNDCIYIVEMKCELAYENYQYLTLESPAQLEHHKKEAFKVFLDVARNINRYTVVVNKQSQTINGSILVWGSCTGQGRVNVMDHYGLADVLSLETIINDLVEWQDQEYAELLLKYKGWCRELFAGLDSTL